MSTLHATKQEKLYSTYALELYALFAPLALTLPTLRDNPAYMEAHIKTVGEKGIADVVKGADKYMQQKIQEGITKLHPDWQFWGEEGNDHISTYQNNKPFLVILDPIEGTNNFIAKHDDQWGSVIALVDTATKVPVVGIVAHPTKRLFYFGIRGSGAYILAYNEHNELSLTNKMATAPIYGYEDFTYNASPHFSPKLMTTVEKFLSMGHPQSMGTTDLEKSRKSVVLTDEKGTVARFVDPESGALEAVRNRGSIFFKTSAEMAAVFVILEEIGGKVTDAKGKPWHLGIDSLVAARTMEDYTFLKHIVDTLKK